MAGPVLLVAREDDLDRVWAIIERVGVGMLTTRGAKGMRAPIAGLAQTS